MDEAIKTEKPATAKNKPATAIPGPAPAAAFEMPKFEIPKFEMPKIEMPAAFREIAEKGVSQAKETYEKMKSAAEEATDVLEDTYSTATKGASDYGLKMIEAARVNTNAAFDFASEMMAAKTLSEMVELSTAHARKQFEALHRAEQGAPRAGAEGRDRDGRADQGRREQGLQEGRLSRPQSSLIAPDKPVCHIFCGSMLRAAAPAARPFVVRPSALLPGLWARPGPGRSTGARLAKAGRSS